MSPLALPCDLGCMEHIQSSDDCAEAGSDARGPAVRPRLRREYFAAMALSVALAVPALVDLPSTGWTGHHGVPRPLPIAPLILDPNLARAGMLTALPGVGPVLAGRIAAEREKMPFADPDDLLRVHGVGPATVAALRPHLRFGPTR